jgi:hypothetical protein
MEADMKLLTLNNEPVDIPDQEYDVVLRMTAADVHKICKDFKDASTEIRIRTTEDRDGVIFSCSVSPYLHCLLCIVSTILLLTTEPRLVGRYG